MNKNLKIIYMGTPTFGALPLKSLAEHYNIVGVVTQPDRVGNRNRTETCAVAIAAEQLGLPLFQYDNVSKQGIDELAALSPDLIVTCAYGQLLSAAFLAIAPLGVLNVHASLLPRYRGASPIYSALLNGETVTGVSIMRTVSKLDAGDVLLQRALAIHPDDDYGILMAKLSLLGAQLIVDAVERILAGKAVFVPQNEQLATYCGKQTAKDERINWSRKASVISHQIRALSPFPLAYTFNNSVRLKIAEATVVQGVVGRAGEVVAADKRSFTVACGEDGLRVTFVVPSGSRLMSVGDYLNGRKIAIGSVLL